MSLGTHIHISVQIQIHIYIEYAENIQVLLCRNSLGYNSNVVKSLLPVINTVSQSL